MSQVYTLEPPTQGKVGCLNASQRAGIAFSSRSTRCRAALLRRPSAAANADAPFALSTCQVILRTTLGDLDIELWAKEAPKAVRNFVQVQKLPLGLLLEGQRCSRCSDYCLFAFAAAWCSCALRDIMTAPSSIVSSKTLCSKVRSQRAAHAAQLARMAVQRIFSDMMLETRCASCFHPQPAKPSCCPVCRW